MIDLELLQEPIELEVGTMQNSIYSTIQDIAQYGDKLQWCKPSHKIVDGVSVCFLLPPCFTLFFLRQIMNKAASYNNPIKMLT